MKISAGTDVLNLIRARNSKGLRVARMDDDEAPTERTTVEARQGGRSRTNLRVLISSTLIAVLILGALYFAFFPRWFPS